MSLYFKAFCSLECYNNTMQSVIKKQQKQGSYERLSASELLAILAEKDQFLKDKDRIIDDRDKRINLLEEYLRLVTIQKYGASSEKVAFQSDLFDEAELEVAPERDRRTTV